MKDRELLELAAKAAGLHVGSDQGDYQYRDDGTWVAGLYATANGYPLFWNPLIDDRDALRLAVKLRMDIEIRICAGYVAVSAYREPDDRAHAVETPGDSAESLRRAITSAAAEIGARITTEDGK